MNKHYSVLVILLYLFSYATAQPKSAEYEKNDFLLNVLWNPSFSLEDFREIGFTSNNTELKAMSFYVNSTNEAFHSKMLKVVGADDKNTRIMVYKKVEASWKIFKEIQYAGGTHYNGYSYGYESPKFKNTSLELRHYLTQL